MENVVNYGIELIKAIKAQGLSEYPVYTFADTHDECLEACFAMSINPRLEVVEYNQLDSGIYMIIYKMLV